MFKIQFHEQRSVSRLRNECQARLAGIRTNRNLFDLQTHLQLHSVCVSFKTPNHFSFRVADTECIWCLLAKSQTVISHRKFQNSRRRSHMVKLSEHTHFLAFCARLVAAVRSSARQWLSPDAANPAVWSSLASFRPGFSPCWT